MKKAKWIWNNDVGEHDTYAEFVTTFKVEKKSGDIFDLDIACDGAYCVYINDKLAGFSGCSDFPWYKLYDHIEINEYCKVHNTMRIIVWHTGLNTQTYIADKPGVIFEVYKKDKKNIEVLAYSNHETQSRVVNEYKNGYKKLLTTQLGYSFLYDATVKKSEYTNSVIVKKTYDITMRPILNLNMDDRLPIEIIKKENSILIDMKEEVAGFLDIDIESSCEQKLLITYGEHITDGGVRRIIGNRDFSVEYVAKKGKNEYLNALRRIAGRYLEIFCDGEIKINYVGIRLVHYPLLEYKSYIDDETSRAIYETSVRTLILCMHEHYEDCPWREQALYTMDSRNQMLCGYYAFDGHDYQRYNLVLIAKSLRSDGLLSICAPSGIDIPIPFFSLVYILQVYEYVLHTNDLSISKEVGQAMIKIIKTFMNKVEDNGLIASFPYPYWNFYEWAEESNNEWQIGRTEQDKHEKSYDLILNCMYVYALETFNKLSTEKIDTTETKRAIMREFYQNGEFKLSDKTNKTSQLGNALAILIGLGTKSLADEIIHSDTMIPATLSMKSFVYDALIKFGGVYKDYVIYDIKRTYKKMLDKGATSFWETEKGEADFDGAGSLCHGWSAIPVYYFSILEVRTY